MAHVHEPARDARTLGGPSQRTEVEFSLLFWSTVVVVLGLVLYITAWWGLPPASGPSMGPLLRRPARAVRLDTFPAGVFFLWIGSVLGMRSQPPIRYATPAKTATARMPASGIAISVGHPAPLYRTGIAGLPESISGSAPDNERDLFPFLFRRHHPPAIQ